MIIYRWLAAAALALSPLLAAAEQDPADARIADPSAAQAAVPALGFQSSFKDYKGMAEDADTPDTVWIAANKEIVGQASHAGHDGQGAASAVSALPEPSGKAGLPAASHADHQMHGMQHGKGH
ncbi:hypothetical protein [Noviherbaspirillum galbum]|uniref:Uncharacterized protein n=1 Tax=Noviherbaspirillum galbum TaxID=2709383 RepID=A0A6B3SH73_9BURK|nr:hypothetical protein [Noviherbaspirillum galbum]NEX59990.1 hypothetical protein [Noviherbaspirillum galbum]